MRNYGEDEEFANQKRDKPWLFTLIAGIALGVVVALGVYYYNRSTGGCIDIPFIKACGVAVAK